MQITPILYLEIVDYALTMLLNSKSKKFSLKKDNTKYRFVTFSEKAVEAFLRKHMLSYIQKNFGSVDRNNKVIIFDTCPAYSNEANELYLGKVSKRKQKLVRTNTPVKYFLGERYIKLPDEKLAILFDRIFDSWFKHSPVDNIYFVRCNTLPAKEAVNQAKTVLKSAMLNTDKAKNKKLFARDINDFIYSRNVRPIYKQNIEYQTYIERLIFPHVSQ